MEQLIEILEACKPGVDFASATRLIDDGVLDSLDIVTLVNELNDEFDIEITVTQLVPENFNSAQAMWKMIGQLQDEA